VISVVLVAIEIGCCYRPEQPTQVIGGEVHGKEFEHFSPRFCAGDSTNQLECLVRVLFYGAPESVEPQEHDERAPNRNSSGISVEGQQSRCFARVGHIIR
jgi:hypothetical protein